MNTSAKEFKPSWMATPAPAPESAPEKVPVVAKLTGPPKVGEYI